MVELWATDRNQQMNLTVSTSAESSQHQRQQIVTERAQSQSADEFYRQPKRPKRSI